MVANAPDHEFRAAGESDAPPLDDLSLESFQQLMAESLEAQKAKNKQAKAMKQQERLVKQKTMSDQFKRTQRYLGLRPNAEVNDSISSGLPPAIDPVCIASKIILPILIAYPGTIRTFCVRPVRGFRVR